MRNQRFTGIVVVLAMVCVTAMAVSQDRPTADAADPLAAVVKATAIESFIHGSNWHDSWTRKSNWDVANWETRGRWRVVGDTMDVVVWLTFPGSKDEMENQILAKNLKNSRLSVSLPDWVDPVAEWPNQREPNSEEIPGVADWVLVGDTMMFAGVKNQYPQTGGVGLVKDYSGPGESPTEDAVPHPGFQLFPWFVLVTENGGNQIGQGCVSPGNLSVRGFAAGKGRITMRATFRITKESAEKGQGI